jgi:hypothetical protein
MIHSQQEGLQVNSVPQVLDAGAGDDSNNGARSTPGVTLRVVVVALLLAVLFGYIIPIIDVQFSLTFLGAAHLPPGAVAVLLLMLLVVNPLLGLLSQKLKFSRNEVLTLYITCLFSALVPGHGAENFFVGTLIGPFYYATMENKWLEFLQPYLKPWLTPALADAGRYGDAGKGIVESWYTGGAPIPWGAWLVPLMAWGSFIIASYIMLGCLSVMLRAQWAEHEALAFPLLRLPLEMTEDLDAPNRVLPGFFCNRLMWVGFGVAVFIQLMNGLNLYFPDVPKVPLDINSAQMFTDAPWNQIGTITIRVLPIAVGITYLLTSEISFSLWFFFWFIKLELIFAYLAGFPPNSLPKAVGHLMGPQSFANYQMVGGYIAYVGLVLWAAREHLKHVLLRGFGRRAAHEDEKLEPLSYPVAFWGFLFSFAFMVGWSVAAGIRFDVALALWVSYIVIAIALTRVVVEGGLLFVQQGWTPLGTIAQLVGSGPNTWLPPSTLVPGSLLQIAMFTDLRAFLMPSFIQSFKLARDRNIKARPLLALIAAVILITFAMSLWMNVRLGYQTSGLKLNGWFAIYGPQQSAKNAAALIRGTPDVSAANWFWLALGGAYTWGMFWARSRFLWFPLHPLGFLMSITYPINALWFSIFLGWLCKVLITRFGGTETYRKTTPMFLGLALGDVTMMLVWLAVDTWQGRVYHQLMPG